LRGHVEGVWGLERGYCLMIGGENEAVERLDPIFVALAGEPRALQGEKCAAGARSTASCGPSGAGTLAKMVHTGIEYGPMAAFLLGNDLFRNRVLSAMRFGFGGHGEEQS